MVLMAALPVHVNALTVIVGGNIFVTQSTAHLADRRQAGILDKGAVVALLNFGVT